MDNTQIPQNLVNRKTYTGTAARILKLMCAGCTAVQAAQAIGVTEAFVSQLAAEDDFQLQIAESLKIELEKAVEIDKNYGDVERQLSERLKSLSPMIVSPDQILRVLKFTNEAKRRTQNIIPNGVNGSNPDGSGTTVHVVQLVLPGVVTQVFVTNPNNEVVAVDERELTTLDSKHMETFAQTKREPPKQATGERLSNEQNKDKWAEL